MLQPPRQPRGGATGAGGKAHDWAAARGCARNPDVDHDRQPADHPAPQPPCAEGFQRMTVIASRRSSGRRWNRWAY
jgi:hypothetical protein